MQQILVTTNHFAFGDGDGDPIRVISFNDLFELFLCFDLMLELFKLFSILFSENFSPLFFTYYRSYTGEVAPGEIIKKFE